ncbi:MAG: CRTAC1 family protein [Archangium sp.]|nr:CRTAC1 family protein [Archangium sp.]
MRTTLCLSLALTTTACLNTASRTELDSTGAVKVNQKLPALKYDDVLEKIAPGTAIACDTSTNENGTRFTDSTESWNLGAAGMNLIGNRLSVADLDSDGYPDLIVHAVSSNASQLKDLPDGGKRLVWQLMNRPSPDGKRWFVDETREGGFFEVAGAGSTTRYRSAQLAVFGDVDNDGDLDAYSGTYVDPTRTDTDPGDRSQILINDGTGHFTLAPATATTPRRDEFMPTSGATFTDVDRDGRLDVFVGHWYEAYGASYLGVQARLFKGAGTGEFFENTSSANLLTDGTGFDTGTNHRPAYGVTSCDLDDDGAPELMVSAYGRQPNLLYRNDGRGRFADQSAASTFAGDANQDFRDNEFFKCWCSMHLTDARCSGVTSPLLVCPNPADSAFGMGTDDQPWRNNGNTFTTWCGDLDGDGRNDLYNAEIHHWWAGGSSDSSELLKGASTNGEVRFTRPGNSSTGLGLPRVGLSWNEGGLMAAGGDLDLDGRMDLIVAASDYPDQFGQIFRQKSDGTFADQGLAWNLRHECMSGLAVADFDRDGDLDVLAGASTARDCARRWSKNEVHLYENQAQSKKWLLVHLEGNGTTTNRSAIGAKVTVTAGGKTYVRELTGGYGHFGMQNDLVLHFGLAGCDGVERVTVRWPDATGTTQTWERLPSNTFLKLKQGSEQPYVVRLQ